MTSRYEESNGKWDSQHQRLGLFAWTRTVFQGAGSSCARWAGALIIAIALGVMPSVLAEIEGDYEYDVIDEKATITKYNGPGVVVVIPDKLGGYPVTAIGGAAFWGKNSLTKVVIPNSVTSIGYQAFGDCNNLASVTIPDSVIIIKGKAFESCSSLASVVLPKAVTDIEADAFAYCSEITRVVIPASVNNIGAGAFAGCSKLTEIDVEQANQDYSSVQGILFNDNQKTLIQYPGGKDGEYQIPNTVTGIAERAFSSCSKLTSVTIPASVTDIGKWAFSGCTKLTGVVIPGSVANIEMGTFYRCSGLVTVVISNGVTNIGESAFSGCSKLVSVDIPDSMIDIAHNAFYNCSSLASVVIPDRVKRFGNMTFFGCTSLASVTLGDSVEAIGNLAFSGCSNLTSIVIPDKAFAIDFSAFFGCTSLISVVIPDSVFSIGKDAFSGCSSLTDLVIPDKVNFIGESAFSGCSSLTSMVIPDKVHTIRKKTFSGCTNLTSVVIKNHMYNSTIKKSAFEGCENLTDIYFASPPPELEDPNEFENCPCTFYYIIGTAGWGNEYAGHPAKIWTIKVTFDGNGGTPTTPEKIYNAGVPCGDLPTANHPGFPFAGWWMEDAKTQIDADTPAPLVAGGCTLYAAYSHVHSLLIGWNLISARLNNLIAESQEQLLNRGAMTLDANGTAYVSNANLAASQACWVYCHEAEDITLLGTPPEDADFEANLKPGWNFVGPLHGHTLSNPGAMAWRWNGRHFSTTENLLAGHGYWLYWPGGYVAPPEDTYLIVDLSAGAEAAAYPVSYRSIPPAYGWTDEYKTTKLVLRKIPAGTFTMGSPEDELGRFPDADKTEPQHQVTLTKDFYVGVFEVTQKQWNLVMNTWPSYFTNESYRDARPVEQVSYDDIRGEYTGSGWPANNNVGLGSFLGRLRTRTDQDFDLPTDAQWEYACRAGTTTALNSGKNLTNEYECPNMGELGRYWWNGGKDSSATDDTTHGTAKVGSYLPNRWGLYDMHGNVEEWCLDWYKDNLGNADQTDPKGADNGDKRVCRGGIWANNAHYCRSACRTSLPPGVTQSYVGFRLVLTLP